jgi:hypothetical protein
MESATKMTIAEERDWVLNEIKRRQLVNMYSYESILGEPSNLQRLFFTYYSTFIHEGLIKVDSSPANNPNASFFYVSLTDKGRAFSDNGGYVEDEKKLNNIKEGQIIDRLTQKLNVLGVWVFGVFSTGLALLGLWLNSEKNDLEQKIKEKDLQIQLLNVRVISLEKTLHYKKSPIKTHIYHKK